MLLPSTIGGPSNLTKNTSKNPAPFFYETVYFSYMEKILVPVNSHNFGFIFSGNNQCP
jgi:hypothetical protein